MTKCCVLTKQCDALNSRQVLNGWRTHSWFYFTKINLFKYHLTKMHHLADNQSFFSMTFTWCDGAQATVYPILFTMLAVLATAKWMGMMTSRHYLSVFLIYFQLFVSVYQFIVKCTLVQIIPQAVLSLSWGLQWCQFELLLILLHRGCSYHF